MSSFIRKPKRKIEIKDEDHTITLKNINLYELTDQYNLKNDIIEKEPPLKQSNFSIVDDQAVKKVSKFKEKSSLFVFSPEICFLFSNDSPNLRF
jgi:ribosomal protein L24